MRGWLERFGVYVVLAVGAWITYKVLTAGGFGVAWRRPGEGGLPFWLAVDLVIAQPVSWLPLVADYNRFAKRGASAFAGTYAGYLAGNVWFYALGALLVLAVGANPGVVGIGTQIAAVAGGSVVLMALLAGETDEAFANIYSWAISAQNIRPELPQPALILTVAGLGSGLALFMSIATFQVFLLLIGSVFVPLFGVFAADYFVLRGARFGEGEMFGGNGRPSPHVRWLALVPWAAGFALYQWSVPTGPGWWVGGVRTLVHGWLHLPFPLLGSSLGASLPSFAVAFGLSLVLLRRRRYSSS